MGVKITYQKEFEDLWGKCIITRTSGRKEAGYLIYLRTKTKITELEQKLVQVEKENKSLNETIEEILTLTHELDEHPEDYNGPCMCKTCQSYCDV